MAHAQPTWPSIATCQRTRSPMGLVIAAAAVIALLQPASALASDPSERPDAKAADRFVQTTSPSDGALEAASVSQLPELLIRCIPIADKLSYCIHAGWVQGEPALAAATVADAVTTNVSADAAPSLGAGGRIDELITFVAHTADERLAEELEEVHQALADAPRLIGESARTRYIEAWLNQQEIAAEGGIQPTYVLPCDDPPCPTPPNSKYIMSWTTHGEEQEQTYYCGPASTAMAANWKGKDQTQSYWWPKVKHPSYNYSTLPNIIATLNTTSGGYSATSDRFARKTFTSGQKSTFLAAVIDRIWTDNDPAISHVEAYAQYFPYFSADWDGHFQVIRGYNLYPSGAWDPTIKVFEPFNEHRFWTSHPVTSGPRDVTDDNMYSATMANAGDLGA